MLSKSIESSSFDAISIFELCFDIDRKELILHKFKKAPDENIKRFFKLINQRVSGKPLQYILGKWKFMSKTFIVEEEVLIPREDTEIIVNVCYDLLKGMNSPRILELCSGSGIISIMLKDKFKDAKITAIEISTKAVDCMKKNLVLHGVKDVKILKQDVLKFLPHNKEEFSYDLIVSNPPYIPVSHIKFLQKEVKQEPQIALNGGDDGLLFYRAIAQRWSKYIKNTGNIVVEIGINQNESVENIFRDQGFETLVFKDFYDIDRVICTKSK
jgi:release factor glutamine methyltransferase